jgi:anti-sigma regulatory factor (Ser/Thr protein kinase)
MGKYSRVPEAESDVEIALREALANTITHGHQENPESTSMSHAAVKADEGSSAVKDEERGLDIH